MKDCLRAFVLLGLLSCNSTREAGLVLVIPSDLSPPEDIDTVRIEVAQDTRILTSKDVPMHLGAAFPLALAVAPSTTARDGVYTFRVIGMRQGRAKTWREAVSDVPHHDVRALTMPVEFLCYDAEVHEDAATHGPCPTGQTCIGGECKPLPRYISSDLPLYREKDFGVGAGVSCYDAMGCFASHVPLSWSRTTCRAGKPPVTQALTLGLLLPPPGLGLPFMGEKLVVFDTDGQAAWRDLGAEILLSPGLCQALDRHSGATLVASTVCASTKMLPTPACKAPEAGFDRLPRDATSDSGIHADASRDGASDVLDALADTMPSGSDSHGLDAIADTMPSDGGSHGPDAIADTMPDDDASTMLDSPSSADRDGIDGATTGECVEADGGFREAGVGCSAGACNGFGACRCRPGATDCDGTVRRTCSADGQWIRADPCPGGCVAGQCTECTPGERRCPDGHVPQACTAAGVWQSELACSRACTEAAVCEMDNVECWGDNRDGQSAARLGSFVSITAGYAHTCGLRVGGSVECWGSNHKGQSSPKSGPFVTIAAGGFHVCGLKQEGTVDCWGDNTYGQTTPRPGVFSAISTGENHTCGLRKDGTIECWGDNRNEQSQPKAGTYTAVFSGGNFSCGLRSDGNAVCWGRDDYGQTRPTSGPFKSLALGTEHGCGLHPSGSVECWGFDNNLGRTVPPAGVFTSIAMNADHGCGLRDNGKVECWGGNAVGEANSRQGPFEAVTVGFNHTCGILKSR